MDDGIKEGGAIYVHGLHNRLARVVQLVATVYVTDLDIAKDGADKALKSAMERLRAIAEKALERKDISL